MIGPSRVPQASSYRAARASPLDDAAARLARTQFKGDPDPGCSSTSRFLLVVDDPERVREQAIRAGAMELAPVGEEHAYAWCLGRVVDPLRPRMGNRHADRALAAPVTGQR